MGPDEQGSRAYSSCVEDCEPIVIRPPAKLALDPFYTKYVDANGIPIVSSEVVSNAALFVARDIVIHMLSKRSDLRQKLIDNCVRVGVIGEKQFTTDIPEYKRLNQECPEQDWNVVTRGVGAIHGRPAASCAEENLLCWPSDRYRSSGESILVHEFGHTIYDMALVELDHYFIDRVELAFHFAQQNDLWASTYARTNVKEYWATGAQHWFDAGGYSATANTIHNHIHTRSELRDYDPALYELLSEVFSDDEWRPRTSRR